MKSRNATHGQPPDLPLHVSGELWRIVLFAHKSERTIEQNA